MFFHKQLFCNRFWNAYSMVAPVKALILLAVNSIKEIAYDLKL